MRPLRPEEREEILALHPAATEQDLEEFEALLSERFAQPEEHEREGPERMAAMARAKRAEARLDAMQRKLFPRFEEAMQRAKERRSSGGPKA